MFLVFFLPEGLYYTGWIFLNLDVSKHIQESAVDIVGCGERIGWWIGRRRGTSQDTNFAIVWRLAWILGVSGYVFGLHNFGTGARGSAQNKKAKIESSPSKGAPRPAKSLSNPHIFPQVVLDFHQFSPAFRRRCGPGDFGRDPGGHCGLSGALHPGAGWPTGGPGELRRALPALAVGAGTHGGGEGVVWGGTQGV